jgi:hypothetical protein
MTASNSVVQPGDVIRIPEAHYRYGFGTLVIRVEEIGPAQRFPDGEWLTVRGMQIAWNGAELGRRQVLVRWRHLTRTAGLGQRRWLDPRTWPGGQPSAGSPA